MQAAPTSTSTTAPFRATTNQDDADDASGGQRDEDISARDSPNEAVMSATSSATHQPYGKDEVKEHGDDTGHKFRRLIKVFRDGMKAPKKQTDEPRTTSSKLSVFVRKRPLSKKELSHKGTRTNCSHPFDSTPNPGYDVITCARNTQLYCHEPKFKVDMSASLVNHLFSFDGY
ncbi:hypothetical protein DYB32_009745 [Aphanomyces invadans]|uniref:Kinesin motor domain-containing protein n=1 Tax=Aphanomyces invadans TaxID=157072 RepID=A0A3R6WF05_9STRA|nr:hypothetical protein DYB32_009745 [Aphanomyces invadans]